MSDFFRVYGFDDGIYAALRLITCEPLGNDFDTLYDRSKCTNA
ncbi:hypothetical protein Bealeia2_02067 (plasmid) [Candidatus Bealeia paramacronuclearis]|nr:hypothetical protein [Candidatus Bealeia paramacronuclearis]